MDAKLEMRNANIQAWISGKPDQSKLKNLDSNIKKNTAFIKKCKTSLAADYRQQLLNDIQKLSLEKYISEAVGGVVEGMLKCKTNADMAACVEVVSALHQRFPDTFTPLLTYNLAKAMQPPNRQHLATLSQEQREKEESTRIVRQRTYLRISVELWLAGVLRNVQDGIPSLASGNLEGVESQGDGVAGFVGSPSVSKGRKKDEKVPDKDTPSGGFVYSILKDLYAHDTEQHNSLPLAAAFLKNYGEQVLGIVPRKQRAVAQQHQENEDKSAAPVTSGAQAPASEDVIVTEEQRQLLKELNIKYYRTVEKHLVKEHKFIKKMDHRNRETLFSRGELSEETKQNYEKATKSYEKLLSNTQILADALDLELPELPEDEDVTRVSIVSAGASNSFSDAKDNLGNGLWEDEDARKFYEDLPDLRVLVPGVFLETAPSKKAEEDKKEEVPEESAEETATETPTQDDTPLEEEADENEADTADIVDKVLGDDAEDASDAAANSKPSQLAQLDALITRLPTLANRDLIDSAAVEFCYLNSKAARKRIVKALLNVPRQRLDVLPYYARFIAILVQYFEDIGEMVLAALEHEFKGLQRKRTQDLLETRVKNIRFLSELTKFRVTPPHTIFHMFKVALDDFTNQNIDIVCNLLETCGRFLMKSPATSVRMGNMLEIVMRKKNVQHLDNRQAMLIENAYYQANPPDRSAIKEKQRSPMELYIRKLIYADLNKKSLDKILRQLRKLHWEDPAISGLMVKIFQKIWKIKYSNIHLIAILASGLNRYHSMFGMQVVDGVVEEIRVGLEHNIFKHNQRRIAVVKYLGELYNYRMVDSPLIFDTLYTITTFGHEFGRPARDRFCSIDAPDDFFRIRLCCTLLDTCGMCFDRGSSKRKLDNFLTLFQMYILTKSKPPMDVDFMISDTFEILRPDMHIYSSYDEANEAVDRMLLEQFNSIQGVDGMQEDGFEDSDVSGSSGDEAEDEDRDEGENGEEDIGSSEETGVEVSDVDAKEDVVILRKKQEQISKEEEEFEREFSRMMNESMESRKFEKKAAVLDVPIPMNLRGAQDRRTQSVQPEESDKMAFTLLTKKGNRQQMKTMVVPADSLLAVSTRNKQEAEREEKQQLKKLVLNYEEREDAAARQAAADERARSRGGFRGKKILHMGGGGANRYANASRSTQQSGADNRNT